MGYDSKMGFHESTDTTQTPKTRSHYWNIDMPCQYNIIMDIAIPVPTQATKNKKTKKQAKKEEYTNIRILQYTYLLQYSSTRVVPE